MAGDRILKKLTVSGVERRDCGRSIVVKNQLLLNAAEEAEVPDVRYHVFLTLKDCPKSEGDVI